MKGTYQLMIQKILTSVFVVFSFITLSTSVYAADFETNCSETQCTPEIWSHVFDSSFRWYPTAQETKTLKIKNTSSESQFVGHRVDELETSGSANLSDVLDIVVRRLSDNTIVWVGTLQQLASGPDMGLSALPSGHSETYEYTITMRNVGNEYQNTSAQFDLVFGYIVPTLTPTPATTLVPSSAKSDGSVVDNGSVQGTSTSCTDQAPGGTPARLSITSASNTATLRWTAVPEPVSYYRIAYGTSSGNYLYGANIGITTTFTVQGLSGGQTYYFVVRAGNGCAPGPFSNEVSTALAGVVIAGPAEGFTEDVLGEDTVEGDLIDKGSVNAEQHDNGEVQAVENEVCQNASWWWMVVVGYGVIALVLLVGGGKVNRIIRVIIQIIALVMSVVLLMIALCTWYFGVLLIVVLSIVAYFLMEGYHGDK